MLVINLQNIEDLVFQDRNLQKELPEFRQHFDQWRLSQMTSSLRSLGKRSILDVLNSLEGHIDVLSRHFGTSITINKLDYHTVKDRVIPLDNCEEELNQIEGYENFSISRDDDKLYVCFWR